MALPIVWHPDYLAPLRPGHRFPMSKYGYLRETFVAKGLLPRVGGYLAPAPASISQVAAVHDLKYVERVANQKLTAQEVRRIGLPGTAAVSRRAFLSAAGTLLAARLALEHGVACNAAGGSHHADREGGAGFCVFNDVAVAAQALLNEGVVGRALILDCDVHQGDGTARIFEGKAQILTVSLHAERNYPTQKARSDLDFPLPDQLRDKPYLQILEHALAKTEMFQPDILFYNAGVDPHVQDRLGRLALTTGGLRERESRVLGWARARGVPVVGVLGGGYDADPERLASRHSLLFEEAARIVA